MLNQAVLVGRIVKDPELKNTEKGKVTNITLAVPRSFKNMNGEYDTDFLDCTLWSAVAESTSEYCKTGDMIGVKGRLQSRIIETPEGTKKRKTEIIAEKVTFLTSNPSRKKKEELRETDEASESDE